MKWLILVIALGLICFVVTVGLAVVDVLGQAEATLKTTQDTVLEVRKRVEDTSGNLNGVLVQLGLAADQWAQASQEQRNNNRLASQEVIGAAQDMRVMIGKIGSETIPALNLAIADSSKNVGQVTAEAAALLKDTNEQLRPLLEQSAIVAGNAAESSAKLNAAMTDVQSTLKHTDETMANVALTSEHVEVAVKRATKPARFMVTLAKTVWDQILKIWTAFK